MSNPNATPSSTTLFYISYSVDLVNIPGRTIYNTIGNAKAPSTPFYPIPTVQALKAIDMNQLTAEAIENDFLSLFPSLYPNYEEDETNPAVIRRSESQN